MKKVIVTIKEQTLQSSRVIELKDGTIIKTLSCGELVFMRVSKAIEVSASLPGKEDGMHGEVAISPYIPNEDAVFLVDGDSQTKMSFEQKSIEHRTTITQPAGAKVKYFVMEEYKENANQSLVIKDGSKWIEVELL